MYVLCIKGKSGRGLRAVHRFSSLTEAQYARQYSLRHPPETTAIYEYIWGEVPKFIEGTKLFDEEQPC